jgi:hypothetical protein
MSVTQGGRTDFNDTVSINNFASASASACLDIVSTTKGALLPRMTTTQQNNISTPAQGLTIYNTTANQLSTYNGTGWIQGTITLIESQVLGSNVATVTFSNIPATYNNLKIIGTGRCTDAAQNIVLFVQFNGDTANNYFRSFIQLSAGAITPGGVAAQPSAYVGLFTGSTATANYPGSFECTIPNYKGTTFYKTTLVKGSANSPNTYQLEAAGSWASTSAITSIVISGGTMITGSSFQLYGF